MVILSSLECDGKIVAMLKNATLSNATLSNATLVSGVEGQDVVTMLQDALNRRGDVKIEICAILNDTTGGNRTPDFN